MIITIEKAKNTKVGINNEMGELMKPNQFSGEDYLLVEFEEMGFDHLQLLLPWSPKKDLSSHFFFFLRTHLAEIQFIAEIICKDDRFSRDTSLLFGGKKKKIE